MNIEIMSQILAKLDGGAQPDPKLDREIFMAVSPTGEGYSWDPAVGPFYTSSVEAALSLVAKLLPGWMWLLESGNNGDHGFTLRVPNDVDVQSDWIVGPPALAVLACLFDVLIMQEKAKVRAEGRAD